MVTGYKFLYAFLFRGYLFLNYQLWVLHLLKFLTKTIPTDGFLAGVASKSKYFMV